MGTGAYFTYIGLYYTAIGMDKLQIGVLTSVGAFIGLWSQPLWGIISDRAKYKNYVLMLCTLAASSCIWLMQGAGSQFWPLVLATAVFSLFQVAINPLADTITLELANKGLVKFANIRMMGSIGYALMSIVGGWIFAANIHSIFAITFAMLAAAFAISFLLPRVEGHQSGKKKVKLAELFKNRPLVVLYGYALALSTTSGFFFAFHPIYSAEQGISMELIGIGMAVGSFSQFPFMMFFQKLYDRFGVVRIFLFSGYIHAVRWLLYAFFLNKFTILPLWLLHGGTYILFYMCLAEYVNTYVIKELKASGQMMNALILLGLSKIIGGVLGGLYATRFGFQSSFLLCFIISLAAVGGFAWAASRTLLFRDLRPQEH
jgi:PPP family 3-phenylpropionic acid transporter